MKGKCRKDSAMMISATGETMQWMRVEGVVQMKNHLFLRRPVQSCSCGQDSGIFWVPLVN